ncbi:right-handed parallel beta-helix repeat-containing protein [Nannocystis punicea]|uniref:Right-handed parallel beta-helix repeat-containing protein n=1 Tax=Nannocystis punicea TaxID=2995304 RepID=A0ABY7HIZ1_9BACT|nr:right-handed parallel beta-helix repeat-containing protein [Nannocystis poenicansa]WAS99020.1 right-handed parallel beta-helix repeat-containing protein [Nannocystis poenicansa]
MTRRTVAGLWTSALLLACGDAGAGASTGSTGSTGGSEAGETTASTGATTSATTGPTTTGASTLPTTAGATTEESSGTGSSGQVTTEAATTEGPPIAGDPCVPWPPAAGPVIEVTPAQAGELKAIIEGAAGGTTIAFAPGTYDVSGGAPIHITTPGLTLRGPSGDRDAVVLDADYATGEILLIAASDTTVVDMTLQRAFWHPIHVTGGDAADITGVTIYDVKVIDPGQQAIKINPSPANHYADEGLIACSWIELTDVGRPQIMDNCYTGGIDAHAAWGWTIRDNDIRGFWCPEGLSEHAVHLWVTSRDTLVERNDIRDCARGVGFGLGENGNGNARAYADDPCPGKSYLGHVGGEIRNNMIWAGDPSLFASQAGFDSGVALEQACDAKVLHNTVVSLQAPFVSMEYRWANTSATIAGNLVTHDIVMRDGAQAQLDGNLEQAATDQFVDAAGADLHLAAGSPAIDAAPAGLVAGDFDAEPREGSPDVGADEATR